MNIIPATAGTDLAAELTSVIGANIVGILAVIFLAVGVRFVWNKFNRATKSVK